MFGGLSGQSANFLKATLEKTFEIDAVIQLCDYLITDNTASDVSDKDIHCVIFECIRRIHLLLFIRDLNIAKKQQ